MRVPLRNAPAPRSAVRDRAAARRRRRDHVVAVRSRSTDPTAERGAGAFRNGTRMHVSNQPGVEGSFLATGFPFRAQQFVHVIRRSSRTSFRSRRAFAARFRALDLAYTQRACSTASSSCICAVGCRGGSLLVTEAEEGSAISPAAIAGSSGQHRRRAAERARRVAGMIGKHVSEDQLDRRDKHRT